MVRPDKCLLNDPHTVRCREASVKREKKEYRHSFPTLFFPVPQRGREDYLFICRSTQLVSGWVVTVALSDPKPFSWSPLRSIHSTYTFPNVTASPAWPRELLQPKRWSHLVTDWQWGIHRETILEWLQCLFPHYFDSELLQIEDSAA